MAAGCWAVGHTESGSGADEAGSVTGAHGRGLGEDEHVFVDDQMGWLAPDSGLAGLGELPERRPRHQPPMPDRGMQGEDVLQIPKSGLVGEVHGGGGEIIQATGAAGVLGHGHQQPTGAHLVRALLCGLVSLQQHPDGAIAHRDLNPRNVLLRGDRSTPILCDLGMARRFPTGPTDDSVTTGQVYSPWYSAPELVHASTPWGLAVDSYGIGAILYELLTGQPPLRRESLQLRQDFVTLTSAGMRPTSAADLNSDLPAPLLDLIDRCLAINPADRPPTAHALLASLDRLRGLGDLPIPYAALRHWNRPTRLRSA